MESQKLISIDMDNLANSNNGVSSTTTINKTTTPILGDKKIKTIDLKKYSQTFRDLLALYDESVQLGPSIVAEICAELKITEPHRVQIYVHKAKNRENFLLNLFNDCQNEIRYFESVIEFLRKFESANFIVQSLRKEKNSIFMECEKNKKSADSLLDKIGNKLKFPSYSSLSTNSSSDSEKILKTNVLLICTSNQQRRYTNRIKRFKDQVEKSNIALKEFDLVKKYDDIKKEFQKWENLPIFLLFDKEIDDLIDFNKNSEMRLSHEMNNIIEIYLQMYMEYLNKSNNRRFYLFLLDEYNEYCVHKNGIFRYHWLLTKIRDSNGKEKFIRPVRIPDYEKPSSESVNFEKFLEYIKAILPFGQINVI